MKIKFYKNFINEEIENEIDESDLLQYDDLKRDLERKIQKSLGSEDDVLIDDFLSAYIRDPDSSQIEGLINDSDVYDFYLSNRNQIDSLLSDVNFYDEIPSDMGSFSLYDYIIKGTKRAILEIITSLKGE